MAAHHHQHHSINEERRRSRRRNYLNPNAQEFHPFFHSFSSSTTSITTTSITNNHNYCYYYNYNHNYPYYYYYNPLHYLPTTTNYPNYPFNHHHHYHLSLMQQTQTQPHPHQSGMGLGQSGAAHHQAAHLRSRGPTSRRYGDSHGSGGGGRRWDMSGSSSNSERKQGHKCNNNDIEWSSKGSTNNFSSCRQMIIPVKADGRETTAMIRNIPNQYTREMLINFLDEFCRLQNQKLDSNHHHHQPIGFDFLYLPMDFKKDANKGYAFVNFTHPIALWKLYLAFSDRRWEHCRSIKICKISCAAIQGKERLVEHFGRSKFRCNHEDYLPVCFTPPRDGSSASVAETAIGQHFPLSSPYIEN